MAARSRASSSFRIWTTPWQVQQHMPLLQPVLGALLCVKLVHGTVLVMSSTPRGSTAVPTVLCCSSTGASGKCAAPSLQVQNEDPTHERLQMFNRLWSINFAHDSLLVFSTGRSPNLFCQLWVSDCLAERQPVEECMCTTVLLKL